MLNQKHSIEETFYLFRITMRIRVVRFGQGLVRAGRSSVVTARRYNGSLGAGDHPQSGNISHLGLATRVEAPAAPAYREISMIPPHNKTFEVFFVSCSSVAWSMFATKLGRFNCP